MKRILTILLLGLSFGLLHVPEGSIFAAGESLLIRMSNDGKYLVSETGKPFFINGDTAWSAIVQLSAAEMDTYLRDRAAKGYNLVLVNLIEHAFGDHAPSTHDQIAPFTGDSFTTPNEAYFQRADMYISKAAENSIVVLLAPLYLGYQCGSEGWCGDVQASSTQDLTDWGEYIGNRYAEDDNIIWIVGGDTSPSDHGLGGKVEAMIAGIQTYDTRHLITTHDIYQSPRAEWGTPAWLDLNNVYSYNTTVLHAESRAEYQRSPFMPVFLLESAYENEHTSTDFTLRRQAYHSVLYGATLGHLFGNCPMWHFDAPETASFCSGAGTWESNLGSTASTQLGYPGKLMESLRFWLMQPDTSHTVLTAGYESGATFAAASYASDNSSMIAYIPSQRQVTVDMKQFGGNSVTCSWFNPRTGAASTIDTYSTRGSQNLTQPTNEDWVLVCDADSEGASPP